MVKEEFDVARLGPEIPHHDLAQTDVRVGIDDVVAAQSQAQILIDAVDVGDGR